VAIAKVKGTGLIEVIRVLRKNRARAMELLPRELHQQYLETRILAGSWYPETDYAHLLRALGKIIKSSWERIGAVGAQTDMTGVYGHMVRGRRVEDVVAMIPGVWRNYHDTGREIVTVSPKQCRIELADFPVIHPDYCKIVGGYNREIIQLAGAVVLDMRKLACIAKGDKSCIWEYDWATPGSDRDAH
jgi:hypothetical protein